MKRRQKKRNFERKKEKKEGKERRKRNKERRKSGGDFPDVFLLSFT